MGELTSRRIAAVDRSEGDVNLSERRQAWYRTLDCATRRIVEADADRFLHQCLSTPSLTAISRAEGCYIWDIEGRKYLDFHGNSVHHIGYGHPRLIEALKRQLDELPFVPRRFTAGVVVELAERLAAVAPGSLQKVLLVPGGSEAMEAAIQLARVATGRYKTLSFWDAFHGASFGSASVGGEALFRSTRLGPLVSGAEHVAPFTCYRCPYGYPDRDGRPDLELCHLACARYLSYVLEKIGDVAAVVAEPVRAVPYLPPPGFWQIVREACDRVGALLIFDEIPTGLGKTGRMWSTEHTGVVPDILVSGKALGGGVVPVAALIARPELDVAGDLAIGHYTHEKNPVLARAALTTLQIIESEGLVERARALGEKALGRLEEMKQRHRLIGDVRGLGLLMGIELVADPVSKRPAVEAAEAIMYRALERGLNLKVSQGAVLSLSPPLVIEESELMWALEVLESCIGDVEAAGG